MNIKDLLSRPAMQLALRRDTDDFQSFDERILDTYLDLI